MTEPSSVVIVGAGLAGAKTAEALREQGYTGRIVLVGQEEELPYERPPLSKDYLAGAVDRTGPRVHDEQWYADHSVELRLGTVVTSAGAGRVVLADGERLDYGALVLATGSEPRRLPVPGADAAGVLTLRRFDDADAIRSAFSPGAALVVIGGGWIGMEVAAVARQAGMAVTIVEAAALPLLRVMGERIATVFAELHAAQGVTVIGGAGVESVTVQDGRAVGVHLADGRELPADLVLVGIGAAPNLAVPESAGVAMDNGVLVDSSLRSSDPTIWAVGDIANVAHPFLDRRIRVEHWASALNQPAVAADSILGGGAVFDDLPYFFTDQYDLGMEYLGDATDPEAVVVRGDLATREFIAFWVDPTGRVLAGMNVNVWDVGEEIKRLIRSGAPIDPVALADTGIPLADLG